MKSSEPEWLNWQTKKYYNYSVSSQTENTLKIQIFIQFISLHSNDYVPFVQKKTQKHYGMHS